jgi:MFS family permease
VGGLLFIRNVFTLMIFRVIQGMCVGVFSALAPLVVKEISPIEISGTLGTAVQLNISFGVLFAYVLNYSLKKIMNDLTC